MKKKQIVVLQLLFFMFAGSNGAFINFINLHLSQVVGLTGTQIGLVSFLGMMAMMLLNPVWGYVGDKTGKHTTLVKVSILLAILAGAFYFNARTIGTVIVAVILLEGGRAALFPLLELIATNFCAKEKMDFGRIRVFASIGFMSIAMLTGFLIDGGILSLQLATFGVFITLCSGALFLSFQLPKPAPKEAVDTEGKKGFSKADVTGLLKNKKFLYIVLLSMISLVTVEAASTYSSLHLVEELGASEGIMSWLVLFMVAPEILLLPLGAVIVKKVGFKNWYVIALLTMILRLGVYAFTTSVALFVAVSMVHGVMICMQVAGNITYVRKVVEPNVLGLAFTLLASLMAFSRAVLSYVFGWVYENMDGFAVFRIGTLLLIVAFGMVIGSKKLNEVEAQLKET